MAPSNSLWTRLKNAVKRVTTWRPSSKKVAAPNKEPNATPDKASVPEQPQAATQKPIVHQDQSSVAPATTMPTLQIALTNNTAADQVYAYISEEFSNAKSDATKAQLTCISRPST